MVATLAVALFRVGAAQFQTHPGFTDAYYYFETASRLARGEGFTTDLVWNFVEAPGFAPLPAPSHRFWMPLATVLQALGIVVAGGVLGPFRAAQLPITLVAVAIAPATYLLARRLGQAPQLAALAAFVAGLGGVDAAAWSSLDNFGAVALLGTLLLASLPGIASGSRRDIAVGGVALGLIVLARADGALYALAPLVLLRTRPRAMLATLLLAALTALPWELRDIALGIPSGQFARAALLVRYEDFFRIAAPTAERYLASFDVVLSAKMQALLTNALTFDLATFVALGPLALVAAWRRRDEAISRGWLVATVGLYLTQSFLFTLHSTRGSFSHSLAGLVPGAITLGLFQLAPALRSVRRPAAGSLVVACLALSAYAALLWRDAFDPPLAVRVGLVEQGFVRAPALVADAASWRYVLDGPALVTPADGLDVAREVARRYGAKTLVLEPGHFSAYDALYEGRERVDWLEPVTLDGPARVWRILRP